MQHILCVSNKVMNTLSGRGRFRKYTVFLSTVETEIGQACRTANRLTIIRFPIGRARSRAVHAVSTVARLQCQNIVT